MKIFSAGISLAVAMASCAFAQSIELRFQPGQFSSAEEARTYIERAAMGASLEFVELDLASGQVRLNGSAAAAQHFQSDPVFLNVTDRTERREGRQFELFLTGDDVFAERGAPIELSPTRRTGWPGERLRVVAYGEEGRVLGEAFIADPRFVRYEGWSADGQHVAGSNRGLIQDVSLPPIAVSLPEETVSISVFDEAGSRFAPEEGRLLGRIRVDQILEAGQ
ncbi:hypothetical protein [Hyphobacterium sp.]|uniref:hypothetical protein n=1 Tax=Hyphobacterium sp. TaxID=2004662 RepID=UPI003BABDF1D